MSAATGTTANRNWDVWAEDDEPLAWSFDPRDGAVQGPLELASFSGASLQLTLDGGQTALLVRDGTLRRAYFAGVHLLRVGAEAGCIAPSSWLIMVETGALLTCRWGETVPLRAPGAGTGEGPRGDAAFRILDPARFYDAFLRHAETVGEPFLRRLLGTLLQARLEELLARTAAPGAPPEETRRRLAALAAGDFAAGWDELGVVCVAFACDQPGVERARASDAAPVPAGHDSPPRV